MSQAAQAQEKREQKLLEKQAEKEEQKQLLQEAYASEGLKKPPLKENCRLAKAVLAIVVALAILAVAPIKLNSRRKNVVNEFKNGTETAYSLSVYSLIQDRAQESQKMKSALENGVAEQNALNSLQNVINKINSESDIQKLVSLNAELTRLTDEVYESYRGNGGDMSLKGIESGKNAVAKLQEQINNMEYWTSAADYNGDRGAFPASLLGGIYSIDYVPAK